MSDAKYNRIKHLVEVDDDILAVFMVSLARERHIENLSIAKNANITNSFVDNVLAKIQDNLKNINKNLDRDNILGRLKWIINETDRIRILIIYEKDRAVIVLIRSNISLSESVDNILGYYYESDKPTKPLF
ncbi:MAG: hypothetical protein ACRD93_01665 [Nitrososphaeraceae archaeon]